MAAVVVSIINLKGGVGKSTLAMILGEFLAFHDGKRVLLIDMDAQGNLSYCMVSEAQIGAQYNAGRTVYHLLKMALEGKPADIRQFITQPPLVVSNVSRWAAQNRTLHMVVSHPSVAELDEDLLTLWENGKPMPHSLRQSLAEALSFAKEDYDYVLIDCPPGLSLFSSTALFASDYYVSPVIPEPLSLQGVTLVQRRVSELKNRFGVAVQFKGVVLNIVKHYRGTHQRTANDLYGLGHGSYEPFHYWLPDNENLRRLGEFEPERPGGWAAGFEHKFTSLGDKYGLSYRLNNPQTGVLSRKQTEGDNYRLEERIGKLVLEFQQRCA
ncbi:MAG: AAA family ATPase [Chloroflexota bacterium]